MSARFPLWDRAVDGLLRDGQKVYAKFGPKYGASYYKAHVEKRFGSSSSGWRYKVLFEDQSFTTVDASLLQPMNFRQLKRAAAKAKVAAAAEKAAASASRKRKREAKKAKKARSKPARPAVPPTPAFAVRAAVEVKWGQGSTAVWYDAVVEQVRRFPTSVRYDVSFAADNSTATRVGSGRIRKPQPRTSGKIKSATKPKVTKPGAGIAAAAAAGAAAARAREAAKSKSKRRRVTANVKQKQARRQKQQQREYDDEEEEEEEEEKFDDSNIDSESEEEEEEERARGGGGGRKKRAVPHHRLISGGSSAQKPDVNKKRARARAATARKRSYIAQLRSVVMAEVRKIYMFLTVTTYHVLRNDLNLN